MAAREYSRTLLTEYSKLLRFKPSVGGIKLEEGLNALLNDRHEIWNDYKPLQYEPEPAAADT